MAERETHAVTDLLAVHEALDEPAATDPPVAAIEWRWRAPRTDLGRELAS